jgi:hypothetical protein
MTVLDKTDSRVKAFHARRFSLRRTEEPELARASGDSGFVAHLSASTHGATGWDWGFRLSKLGADWAFVTDGKLTVFVDEPGQYVPAAAKPGDQVALRLPRARENLHPHRFTLNGGQGPVVVSQGFSKFFLPVTFEAVPQLVELCASHLGDQLRFSLYVANSPLDYERADSAVLDVGSADLPGVTRMLEAFTAANPFALQPRGLPHATHAGPQGLPVAEAKGRADLADGFGWRRSAEALAGAT